jgi:hypothetical protein
MRLHLNGRRISQARNQQTEQDLTFFADCYLMITCLAYSWILKMDAKYSSETPVDL